MTRTKLATGLLALSLASIFTPSHAADCPLLKLAQLLVKMPKGLKAVEVPLEQIQSTEGGFWKVFVTSSGRTHSIERTDFGETGRWHTSLVLLNRQNVAIRNVMIRYREPIGSGRPVKIATRTATDYFVCGDTVYAPARASAPESAAEAMAEADRLRRSFFEANELAKYLK